MAKYFLTIVLACLATGVLWPWLGRLGLGRLPGDVRFVRKGSMYYFPFTSCLLVTAILTLIAWLFRL